MVANRQDVKSGSGESELSRYGFVSASLEHTIDLVRIRRVAILIQRPGLWSSQQLVDAANFFDEEHFATEIASSEWQFELLVQKDEVLGFWGRRSDYLGYIFLHPKYQGLGLGKTLLERAENQVLSDGHREIWLLAQPYSLSFYEQRGYITGETRNAPYNAPVVHCTKKLTA